MIESSDFRSKRLVLNHGGGCMPALGFGMLIPDAAITTSAAGGIAREDIFVTTKLWDSNHRPKPVEPAFDASLERLGLDYLDLYLIHTPFTFQPGDEQDLRDADGDVIYDKDGIQVLSRSLGTQRRPGRDVLLYHG